MGSSFRLRSGGSARRLRKFFAQAPSQGFAALPQAGGGEAKLARAELLGAQGFQFCRSFGGGRIFARR